MLTSMERALRASQEDFRVLAESMPQHVWVTRPDGSTVYVNQQWVDYTGLTQEQSSGRGWDQVVHADDLQMAREAWQRANRSNELYAVECRVRRADGQYRWRLVRGVPMRDATGQVVKWCGTSTDIDDLKQAETALRDKERELAQSLARQRSLSRHLADVRDAEQKDLSGRMDDRIGQNLAALRLNLDLVAQMEPCVRDDLCAARLSDSRALLEATIAAVNGLVTELRPAVLDDYGLLAGLRGLAETVQARSAIAIAVVGDEPAERLARPVASALFRIAQEALANICRRAQATRVELSLRCSASAIRLAIADDGAGAAEVLPDQQNRWSLLLMQERAESVGATLRLETSAGGASRIVVQIP